MSPELLTDLDPVLEKFFSKFTTVEQGILESLPWEEISAGNGVVRRTFSAKIYIDHMFWPMIWRPAKDTWRRRGFSVSKPDEHWRVQLSLLDLSRKTRAITESAAVTCTERYPVPAGLAYYEFQKAGIKFLAEQPSALLADDMGLGKTIMTAGLLNARPDIRSVLIVCPASVKLVWERELKHWLVDKSKGISVAGRTLDLCADIWICNYDRLAKFKADIETRSPLDLIVFDEAHFIKNSKAQRTKLANQLAGFARRKLLLTGTPLLSRPAELWSLLHLLDAKAWGSFFPFALRYCNAHQNSWGWDFTGASNIPELNDRLRSSGIMLRRMKEDVMPQLPRVTRQIIPLSADMSPILDRLEEEAARELGLEPGQELPFEVDPTRVAFELIAAIRHETGLLKVEPAIAFIKETVGDQEKLVVFGHHTEVLNQIHAALPNSVLVTGSTPQKDRQKAIDRFQGEPEVQYFIASTTAMGVGITLTASSHVIFIEPDWVPGVLRQAEDRLCRIGQQANSVLAQYLVVANSIDEKIMNAVQHKVDVIESVLEPPS